MSTSSGPRAAFGVKKQNVPGVLFRSQTMYDFITTNAAMFAAPTVTMAAFLALITALSLAQQVAKGTKATGSASLRNSKRNAVWTAMESLRAYVQGLADVLSPDDATYLIESAGLAVAGISTHRKALLTPTLTTTPGVVRLVANRSLFVEPADARKNVSFNWQWSADGGATWNDARSTPHASTAIAALALMSTYSFRASVTIGNATGAWSQVVSLLVH
jgi:hypothetical protein